MLPLDIHDEYIRLAPQPQRRFREPTPVVTNRCVLLTTKCPWSKRRPYLDGTTSDPRPGNPDLAAVVVTGEDRRKTQAAQPIDVVGSMRQHQHQLVGGQIRRLPAGRRPRFLAPAHLQAGSIAGFHVCAPVPQQRHPRRSDGRGHRVPARPSRRGCRGCRRCPAGRWARERMPGSRSTNCGWVTKSPVKKIRSGRVVQRRGA